MTWTLDASLPTLDAGTGTTLDGVSASGTGTPTVFAWVPSPSSSLDTELTLREAKFGDGYRLRAGTGLNNIVDKWDLVFHDRLAAEVDAIETFLRARSSGQSFQWTPYGKTTPVMVFCQKWKISVDGPLSSSVTCTFERVYGE